MLHTEVDTSLSLQQAEVANIALWTETGTGIDAPTLWQLDGVIPSQVQVRMIECDGSTMGCGRLVVLEEQINKPCRMPSPLTIEHGPLNSGTGVWIEAQLIIVFLCIDGTYQTDQRIVGTRIWLCRHRCGILHQTIIDAHSHPLVA